MEIAPLNTIEATCKAIACGVTKAYQLIGDGRLDAVKAGVRTLVTGESIERYIKSLPKATIRTGQDASMQASDAADQPPIIRAAAASLRNRRKRRADAGQVAA